MKRPPLILTVFISSCRIEIQKISPSFHALLCVEYYVGCVCTCVCICECVCGKHTCLYMHNCSQVLTYLYITKLKELGDQDVGSGLEDLGPEKLPVA